MIIFNTTFQVSDHDAAELLEWLRGTYVPQALATGLVAEPQLARVMGSRDEGRSYALQVTAQSLGDLQKWHLATGRELQQQLAARFGTRVLGFSTMLEKIDI